MKYITAALSLNMLSESALPTELHVREVSLGEGRILIHERKSLVGHPDTASLFTEMLGVAVLHNRESVALEKGDSILVGQYRGPRLPEGSKNLPQGATIKWLMVDVL